MTSSLVKVDTRATAAVNAMRADYPKVTGGKPKAPSDHAAYYHGKRDGASIQQRTALNGHTRMLGQ